MRKAANHDTMRNANLLTVFHTIRCGGPITKKELQRETGLSWGSISNITGFLLEKGIITEQQSEGAVVGRTPMGLDINLEHNLIVGLDINLQGMTGVVIDLKGRQKLVEAEPLRGVFRPAIMEQATAMIHRLLDQLADPAEVKGIGISFPGHVDSKKGVSIKIHHFQGFEGFNLRRFFQDEFGLEVIVEHDTNCLAVAEHDLGVVQGVDNFVILRLCKGIGMGTFSHGRLFHGRSGATGEVGHMIINTDGPRCQCGHHGCLESYASVHNILRQCGEAIQLGLAPVLEKLLEGDQPLTLEAAAEAARQQESSILHIFQQAAAYTGVAIANVVAILDPDVVVLSGELAAYGDLFLPKLMQVAQDSCWRTAPIEFRVAHNHCYSAAVGAASLFIQKAFLNAIDDY
ncbi:ROK family protein [Oscillospiraceae bacterium MB08-C2-2]|nr:ROK family protein [Oscillospiraceae bacterium MB08-C2-2]